MQKKEEAKMVSQQTKSRRDIIAKVGVIARQHKRQK